MIRITIIAVYFISVYPFCCIGSGKTNADWIYTIQVRNCPLPHHLFYVTIIKETITAV